MSYKDEHIILLGCCGQLVRDHGIMIMSHNILHGRTVHCLHNNCYRASGWAGVEEIPEARDWRHRRGPLCVPFSAMHTPIYNFIIHNFVIYNFHYIQFYMMHNATFHESNGVHLHSRFPTPRLPGAFGHRIARDSIQESSHERPWKLS